MPSKVEAYLCQSNTKQDSR